MTRRFRCALNQGKRVKFWGGFFCFRILIAFICNPVEEVNSILVTFIIEKRVKSDFNRVWLRELNQMRPAALILSPILSVITVHS